MVMVARATRKGPPAVGGAGPAGPRRAPAIGPDRLTAIARAFVREARLLAPAAPDWREWALVAASDEAEVWTIAWPPGESIELHDHGGSGGAVVVISGELFETSVAFSGDSGRVSVRPRLLAAGDALAFGPNRVHDIVNRAAAPALSVHAYAPRLSVMTYYRVDDGELVATRATHARDARDARDRVTRSVDELLASARERIGRVGPGDLEGITASGGLVVDIRPAAQRAEEGELPDAVVLERNVLEWRLDPASPDRLADVRDHEIRVVVVCSEGYASSLAAAALVDLGLSGAADLEGGYVAWRAWSDAWNSEGR